MLSWSRNSFHFMEPEYFLPFVKQPACCLYPENDKDSSLPSTLFLSKCYHSLAFAPKIMKFSVYIMNDSCSAHQFYKINNICRRVQIMSCIFLNFLHPSLARGGVVVKALRYKPAGREFDPRWCHWNLSVT
jgi:hypothetical protein